jgi:hypothetical protein
MFSPSIQRNLDHAQYPSARGSQYAGPAPHNLNSDGQNLDIEYRDGPAIWCEGCGLVEPNHITMTCPYTTEPSFVDLCADLIDIWCGSESDLPFEDQPDYSRDLDLIKCEACGYESYDTGWPTSADQGHENLCCQQSGFRKDEDCGDHDCVTHAVDLHYGRTN